MGKKTKIIAIISAVYFLIAAGVLACVVYEVSVSGVTLSARVAAIGEKNARSRVFNELQRSIESSAPDRKTLAGYVLTEDETSSFLTELEGISAAQGVTLTTDSLKVVRQDTSFVDQLIIDFSLRGNGAAVENMLGIFETLPYHSQITAFTLRKEKDNTVGTLELTISLLKHAQ